VLDDGGQKPSLGCVTAGKEPGPQCEICKYDCFIGIMSFSVIQIIYTLIMKGTTKNYGYVDSKG